MELGRGRERGGTINPISLYTMDIHCDPPHHPSYKMASPDKPDISHVEGHDALKPGDVDLINVVRVPLTEEDNKHIRHKTDRRILIILIWVYFLQILILVSMHLSC